jgi:hypothetical protein
MLTAAAVFVRRVRAVHLRGKAVDHRLELGELLLERGDVVLRGQVRGMQRLPDALVERLLRLDSEEKRVCWPVVTRSLARSLPTARPILSSLASRARFSMGFLSISPNGMLDLSPSPR